MERARKRHQVIHVSIFHAQEIKYMCSICRSLNHLRRGDHILRKKGNPATDLRRIYIPIALSSFSDSRISCDALHAESNDPVFSFTPTQQYPQPGHIGRKGQTRVTWNGVRPVARGPVLSEINGPAGSGHTKLGL